MLNCFILFQWGNPTFSPGFTPAPFIPRREKSGKNEIFYWEKKGGEGENKKLQKMYVGLHLVLWVFVCFSSSSSDCSPDQVSSPLKVRTFALQLHGRY